MSFEVTACDPNTGTVLNEQLEWHIAGADTPPITKTFEDRKAAENFADEIHERRADVEIWITNIETKEAEMIHDGGRSRYEIYCEILYRGLLDIRSASGEGDTERCFAQADHLHNMPGLLKNLDNEELHDFYWRCMRIDYDRPERENWPRVFDNLWKELECATIRETGQSPNKALDTKT